MGKIRHIMIFAAILVQFVSVYAAPIDIDTDIEDIEEESERNISEEVINYEDPEIVTTREKRYFENYLENQSMEQRRQRIHHLKQKNSREQRRRREQRKKKLLRSGRKKLRVNRNTSR